MVSRILPALFLLSIVTPVFAMTPLWEQNRGQFPESVLFLARSGGVSTALTDRGISFEGMQQRIALRFERAAFDKCKPASAIVSEAHYLGLRTPISHVPRFSSVSCADIYRGVDWVIHNNGDSIEHDWNLEAGVDPREIVFTLEGDASASVVRGDLELRLGDLKVVWKAARSFQMIDGLRREVRSEYAVQGRSISLRLGARRSDLPLVIDPVIDFSYVVNTSTEDRSFQVARDGAGNIYIAGLTDATDLATTPGAVYTERAPTQTLFDFQLFIQKLTPDGSKVLYSTYLGHSDLASHPVALRVDAAGNAYVATDGFYNVLPGATPIDEGGVIGLYKLSPGGDSLVYAARMFAGLSYGEVVALALDASGNAYVGAGRSRMYISKIDPTGTRQLYRYESSYSSSPDGWIADLAVGSDGSLYMAGTTAGGGLTTTAGALHSTMASPQNSHGFLMRLKADGSGPLFTTYVGGSVIDKVYALEVDADGNAYVGGEMYQDAASGGLLGTSLGTAVTGTNAGFITKIAPEGDQEVYFALLPKMAVTALRVDGAGRVYAGGHAIDGKGFVGYDATQGSGVVLARVDPTGEQLLSFSNIPANLTFTGSPQSQVGLTIDGQGAAYLTGSMAGIRIPDFAPTNQLASNAFLVKLDANPAQSDVWVEGVVAYPQSAATSVRFIVHNSGPAAAEGVEFIGTATGMVSCTTNGSNGCNLVSSRAVAFFDSIPAGGSQTVDLNFAAGLNLSATGSVTVVSSDVNYDNNSATATSQSGLIPIGVIGSYGAVQFAPSFTVSGASRIADGGAYVAAAGTQVQVTVTSPMDPPQNSHIFFPLVFQKWSDGSTDNPRTFTITPGFTAKAIFTIASGPALGGSGVASAASYSTKGVAPGEFVMIGGTNFGTIGNLTLQNGRVTTQLGSATVSFDGVPAPLVYTSPKQINAIVPYSVAGKDTTTMLVKVGSSTVSTSVPVVQADPALFTSNASGTGQVAALNADSSINSAANPANIGDIIVLYGTGEGLVTPVPLDGSVTSTVGVAPQLPVTVSIGGMDAQVVYAAAAPGLAAGVIQINAVIPAGITPSHHVPVVWKAGNFSSQAGATIAVNSAPAEGFAFPVGTKDPSLMPITISPSRIAADSNDTVVTVRGSGFTSGMTVKWNNQARGTTFIDSSTLQVTLGGGDLDLAQTGSIAVWDAGQTKQLTSAASLVVYLPLANRDIAYDPVRNRIYAAVAATQAPQGSSIAVINPEVGRIEKWYSLESEPSKVTVSDDGKYLYVALGNTVRRIVLETWTPDLDIALGDDPGNGPRGVESFVVLPGVNNALAVSFRLNFSPPYGGTAVFDDGRMRPIITPSHDGPEYLTVGPDASLLYGTDSAGEFYAMQVSASGVKIVKDVEKLFGNDGYPAFAGGLLYGATGKAVDPAIPRVVQMYDSVGLMVPMPELGKLITLGYPISSSAVLSISDLETGKRLSSLPLFVRFPSTYNSPAIRWGSSGVALREGGLTEVAPNVDLIRLDFGR